MILFLLLWLFYTSFNHYVLDVLISKIKRNETKRNLNIKWVRVWVWMCVDFSVKCISIKSLLIGTSLLCACEVDFCLRIARAHIFIFIFISFYFIHRTAYYNCMYWSANSAMQIFEYKCFGKSFHGNLRCSNEPHGSDTNQATKIFRWLLPSFASTKSNKTAFVAWKSLRELWARGRRSTKCSMRVHDYRSNAPIISNCDP